MARSMWRGAIQFGLVTIPVKLYLATEQGGIGFNLLHASCLNRIQMKIYCPYHDEVIPRSETVRGYEWSKGKYVVVTDEDIDSVPLKTVRAIEIEMFITASREAQGTQFVKQAYYLEPEPVGTKAFYLLKQVLAEQDKRAICKIVLKQREQLAALNPFASTLLLTTLHWPDEVRAGHRPGTGREAAQPLLAAERARRRAQVGPRREGGGARLRALVEADLRRGARRSSRRSR
jgi:DNA end-binding protein Ku